MAFHESLVAALERMRANDMIDRSRALKAFIEDGGLPLEIVAVERALGVTFE